MEPPSPEEEERMMAYAAAQMEKLADGVCCHCDTPIEREVQVGRSVYGEPCGCRLFQGEPYAMRATEGDERE